MAIRKRNSLPDLKVIGVTGSVGKTSTKTFLETILSQKFKTVATSEHDNTDIGISRRLLKDVDNYTEVFIAEMGAYKVGEIKYLCNISKPQIGILTHIGSQHLDLFGSLEAIKNAKFELIQNLVGEKIAVLNLDSPTVRSLVSTVKDMPGYKISTYSVLNNADITASSLRQEKDGVSFVLQIGNKSSRVKAKVFGFHFISNILACCAAASRLGMEFDEIKSALEKVENPPDAVKKLNGPKKSIVFDDTYNASPESVAANIELLNSYPGLKKKILILQPMIELGNETDSSHEKVGEYLKEKRLDLLILTNSNFANSVLVGAGQSNKKVKIAKSPAEIEELLLPQLGPGVGIIFKGKESVQSLKRLMD